MSARHKTLLLGALLCAACCAPLLVAVAWFSCSPLRIRVFDSTLHVLSVRVLKSQEDRFYLGNQIEGRARSFLRDRCHLKITPLAEVAQFYRAVSGQSGCTLALRYSCEAAQSPVPLDLELVDCSGASVGVGGYSAFGTNPRCLLLDLDSERSNAGDYTLRLKRAGVCAAEIDVKGLPPVLHQPFHLGPNAF